VSSRAGAACTAEASGPVRPLRRCRPGGRDRAWSVPRLRCEEDCITPEASASMLALRRNTCLCGTLPAMIDPAKIEAGRELDRLIAEKVMGLTPGEPIPPYSTDIAAAWTVVETMIHKD